MFVYAREARVLFPINRKMILGGPARPDHFDKISESSFCAAILSAPKNVLISGLDIRDVVCDITAKKPLDHASTKRF